MTASTALSQESHAQGRHFAKILSIVAGFVLAAALFSRTPVQISALLVAAIITAILDRFPIYLNPIGEIPITGVITVPTIVLFGWPTAVIGSALAIVPSFFSRSTHPLILGSERLIGLATAAWVVQVVRIQGPYKDVSIVIMAALAVGVTHTATAAIRLHFEEGIAWLRAFPYLVEATSFHHVVVMAVATAAVWTLTNSTSNIDRLLVPVIAAAVTLQLYLPRILRGQQQRRVLAAVSVLAAAVDAKDSYTADHSQSVAQLCQRVARALGLNEQQVHRVYLAALLHDVGKTVVPIGILRKPGPLTLEERDVIRSHVDAGVRIIKTIRGLADIAPIVEASHERMDGAGYPKGLKGDDIPLAARIILAVDAYNAMTTNRTYRPARPPADAFQELDANAGTQFDPQVVAALRDAAGVTYVRAPSATPPSWVTLLQRPAFTLLWAGEMVSFIGDNMFFVGITFWVLTLTGSATMVASTLIAATLGQGLTGLLAGALADRIDRRRVIVATDLCRAAVVVAIPFFLSRSLPAWFLLLIMLNVGTVFFRTAVFALIPLVVPREDLATANALFQTTQRMAEIIGSVLGGIVVSLGLYIVFYLDAATFIVSAVCVSLMPLAWRAGLSTSPPGKISADIVEGLRYIWHTPLHRVLALLAVTGYLTLAFDALQSPMVVKTAGLSAVAYGVINSSIGVGKLVAATALTAMGKRLTTVSFVVIMFLLTSVATALFGTTVSYRALIAAAFLFGLGNISTNIANTTLSLANVPSMLAGRLMASRQVFIAATTLLGMLVFGALADLQGAPVALIALGITSGIGVLAVWLTAGRHLRQQIPATVAGGDGQK